MNDMRGAAGQTQSLWMATQVDPQAVALDIDLSTDVVVIGSGIAGLSTAYELSAQGHRVVVVDRAGIAGGMTSRTSAHLTPFPDDSNKSMVDRRGIEDAKQFYFSQRAAVDRIEFLQSSLAIGCDFRRLSGYLFPGPETTDEDIDAEIVAALKSGILVADGKGLPFDGLKSSRRIEFPEQATFHPLKYLSGLVRQIRVNGGLLYRDTPIVDVSDNGESVVVTAENGYCVRAAKAVVATNAPIHDQAGLNSKQSPYRTFVVAFEIPKGAIWDGLFWDMMDPYHYVRLHAGRDRYDYLIVGGEDYKSGTKNDGAARFARLEQWIRGLVPSLGRQTHAWSGQVLDTLDYSAFIGLNPGDSNIYVCTGDSGQGLTHGVVASLLIPTLINHDPPGWASVYDPSRKPVSAAWQFATENVTAVASLAERLTPGEVKDAQQIPVGEGAIIRRGLTKLAAYRDDNGALHEFSAACSHMGCIVHWNSTEKCWDCPCHGSQFAADGTVLNGPAVVPLTRADPIVEPEGH